MKKLLKLEMPICPKCNSCKTEIDIKNYSNIIRIPAATATTAMIGIPLNNIAFVCKECKHKFYNTSFI